MLTRNLEGGLRPGSALAFALALLVLVTGSTPGRLISTSANVDHAASPIVAQSLCEQLEQARKLLDQKANEEKVLANEVEIKERQLELATEAKRQPHDDSQIRQAEQELAEAERKLLEIQRHLDDARRNERIERAELDKLKNAVRQLDSDLAEARSRMKAASVVAAVKVDKEPRVLRLKKEMEELRSRIAAGLGAFSIDGLAELQRNIDTFYGQKPSTLYALHENRGRKADEAASYDVNAIDKQIKELRASLKPAIDRLRIIHESELPDALRNVPVSPTERALLDELQSGKLKETVDGAQRKRDKADEALNVTQGNLNKHIDSAREREKLVATLDQEKQQRIQEVAAAKARNPDPAHLADAANKAYEEAKIRLEAAKKEGKAAKELVSQLEAAVKNLERQIKQLIATGRTHGSSGVKADRASRKDECLRSLRTARTKFQAGLDLSKANPCLHSRLRTAIQDLLTKVEQTSCGGDRLGARPVEGGGFKETGPSGDKSSLPGPIRAEPSNPNDANVRGAKAALANCNFQRARASLDQYQPDDPQDPWMAETYAEIFRAQERLEAAEELLARAVAVLQRPNPTRDEILFASGLIKEARTTAPACISQRISDFTPELRDALAAFEARERERKAEQNARTSEALGAVLSGLTGVIGQVRAARNGGSTYVPPSPGDWMRGAGGATDCGGCAISGGGNGPLNYIFQRTVQPKPGCSMTVYYLFSGGNDDGSFARSMESGQLAVYGQKLCGPCGTYSQAEARVKGLCRNPKAIALPR